LIDDALEKDAAKGEILPLLGPRGAVLKAKAEKRREGRTTATRRKPERGIVACRGFARRGG